MADMEVCTCVAVWIWTHKENVLNPNRKDLQSEKLPRNVPSTSSALFFKYTALGRPTDYRVLVDTNLGWFDVLLCPMTFCTYIELLKNGTPCITDYPRFERLPCTHKGTYADDCLVERVTQHKCYMVATCDRNLKRRICKIPGVPIMYITKHKYSIERLPEATMGGAPRF
ncbi:hypothetical protein DCAR_0206021 [Daucus carota subsp. sativus]|uniref:PIN domain-containing protein n=1 Tax=Daucus carota subsp. sativus TaxID=79200 RepID=A0AAF1AL78_DAUCS|nr:hypothetical protein DCAR_0206021 [Daucus carota subsp. sativus]